MVNLENVLEKNVSKEKNQLKPIDASVYNYWSALYLSFYSRRLYVDVGKRWHGLGLLYLILAIALFSIPFFLRTSYSLGESFKQQITEPLSKIPVFYIQNGVVSFDKPMPYLIKDNKGNVVVVIDTTGTVNDFNHEYPYLTILINKDKISVKSPRLNLFFMNNSQPGLGSPLVETFNKEDNLVFDGKKLAEEKSLSSLKYFSQAILYPMIIGMFFSVLLIFFLVLGFLGQVFSSIFFSFKISFIKSTRLLIVAGTPMVLLLLSTLAMNLIFIGLGTILFFLLIAYYSFALYALRSESKQVVIS